MPASVRYRVRFTTDAKMPPLKAAEFRIATYHPTGNYPHNPKFWIEKAKALVSQFNVDVIIEYETIVKNTIVVLRPPEESSL